MIVFVYSTVQKGSAEYFHRYTAKLIRFHIGKILGIRVEF